MPTKTCLTGLRVGTSAIFCAALLGTMPLQAATIAWTQWTSAIAGDGTVTPGSATGTMALSPGITVTYSGQNGGLQLNQPPWTASSFSGGTVGNAPPSSFNSINNSGGVTTTDTVAFSAPVTNPVMAIFDIGSMGVQSEFDFTSAEPFMLEAAGPCATVAGSSGITVSGTRVLGMQSCGVIQFNGTFSQITWTNPVYEASFDFTVGAPVASVVTGTPEPASLAISSLGIGIFAMLLRRRRQNGSKSSSQSH